MRFDFPCPVRRLRAPEGEGGFTAMELLVGLGVVALLLAASLPRLHAILDGHRHSSAVSSTTSRFFLTRQLAVREKVPYVITADDVNGQFSVFEDANSNGAFDAGEETLGPYAVGEGISLQNLDWNGNQLTFFPNGSASQTASVSIVGKEGRSKTVRVNSITGNTEVLP